MSKTLTELAQEIERQNNAKKDFASSTRLITWTAGGRVDLKDQGTFSTTDHFENQVADRLEIPNRYFQRMKQEAPALLAANVNHWFQNQVEKRMVRTLDGKARAFLSDRYRTLDNYDMLNAVLPVLQQHQLTFQSCEVTERRMYLKVLFPKVKAEVKKGDMVQAGVVVSNSEVGSGSFKVEPFIFRLVCTNGMICESVLNKYHVGRGFGGGEDSIYEILRDATKAQNDKALFLMVRDLLEHSLTTDAFEGNLQKLKDASERKITGDVPEVVRVVSKKFGFTDSQGSGIFRHLVEGGDLSQWGLANAVTRSAQDQEEYDEETRFERMGGKIIELPQTDWKAISSAN